MPSAIESGRDLFKGQGVDLRGCVYCGINQWLLSFIIKTFRPPLYEIFILRLDWNLFN